MHFVSYTFLIFFAGVFVLVCCVRHRLQNLLLLVGSYVFYGWWDWRFLGLILLSSLVDYICGLQVDATRGPPDRETRRKCFLVSSIVVNLGILCTFKYLGFFIDSATELLGALNMGTSLPALEVILPVGISFYTFQTMGYTIDVYRGRLKAVKQLPEFMLYVSFFPQLVAGPIERAEHLLPQILNPRPRRWDNIASGAQLMLVGFFKKMVLADNIAVVVNEVYSQSHPGGPAVLIGTYAFAVQIYCDFSGYTDIARGVGRMLGFHIRENFRLPYFATNPREFWQRWHISLSSWLRDYLYIPLGGNRGPRWKVGRNLALTMLLGGLWHGAAYRFVLWGAYHAGLLIGWRLFEEWRSGKSRPEPRQSGFRFWLKVFIFFHLICLGWIFFRATSIEHIGDFLEDLGKPKYWRPVAAYTVARVLGIMALLFGVQWLQLRTGRMELWTRWPVWLRILFYLVCFYAIVLFGVPVINDFLYFQF